jgi:hypothetical protein
VSRIEDVDVVVLVLYGFLVLCSWSFCFVEFVQSCCAVFFEAISQLPSLTVSEFYFFVQLGRPPLFGSKYGVRRGFGLGCFLEHRLCLVVFLLLFFWFSCCFRLDFFDWLWGWGCCHGPSYPSAYC